jgi:hypothetical protein
MSFSIRMMYPSKSKKAIYENLTACVSDIICNVRMQEYAFHVLSSDVNIVYY